MTPEGMITVILFIVAIAVVVIAEVIVIYIKQRNKPALEEDRTPEIRRVVISPILCMVCKTPIEHHDIIVDPHSKQYSVGHHECVIRVLDTINNSMKSSHGVKA